MIYLDASAAVKLVLPERESPALEAYLASAASLTSSIVSLVEIPRAVERVSADPIALDRLSQVLERIDTVPIDQGVVALSRSVPAPVRALDAIHLATALSLGDGLDALVAYDQRLLSAARDLGLAVAEPA